MWIPRLSLKSTLVGFTALGLYFSLITLAVQGNNAALAVSVAIGSLALTVFVYAMFFLAALLLAGMLGISRRKPATSSPFATEVPPPQIIPPFEPD
jgi:ABC-type Na+ efflux pump permease subunit